MNKFSKLMLVVTVIATLFSACKKSSPGDSDQSEVQFTSAIQGQLQGRMTGDAFEAADAIGVFMKSAGATFSSASYQNKQYLYGTSGTFTAANAEERIYYPESGNVDFVAYYPYQDGANSTYAVNVADQGDLGAIDLLYATAENLVANSGTPRLTFTHELSKVEITVNAGAGVADLNGLTVTFKNFATTASYDLATQSLESSGNEADIAAKLTPNGSTLAEAILLPGSVAAKQVVFGLNGKTFTWTLPSGSVYEAGTKYTYTINLIDESGLTEVEVESDGITDWTESPGGTTDVNSDGGNGGTTPGTGGEELLYNEEFSTETTVTTTLIGAYTGYTAPGYIAGDITYSNVGAETGYGDIRSTAAIGPHVWLPANRNVTFQVAGIDTEGAADLRLEFQIRSNNSAHRDDLISINFNGVDFALPTGISVTNSAYTDVVIELTGVTASASSTLQFIATSESNPTNYGVRVDNIKLYGTK